MKNLINYQKGFISTEDALKISEYCSKYDHEFSDYGNEEQEFTIHIYPQIESNDAEILSLILDSSKKVYEHVLDFYDDRSFMPFDQSRTHLSRFSAGPGMHPHFDFSRPNDIATLIYLNDSYEGGEIYFPEYDIEIKPSPGDLLTFPDNPNFVHGVKGIVSGTRYTIPRWFTSIV